VRDDNARQLLVCAENLIDPFGEAKPIVHRQVVAGDVQCLLDPHVGVLVHLRYCIQQFLRRQDTGPVIRQVRRGGSCRRNRSTCCKNQNFGQRGLPARRDGGCQRQRKNCGIA
jgi:hypothetical protein